MKLVPTGLLFMVTALSMAFMADPTPTNASHQALAGRLTSGALPMVTIAGPAPAAASLN